MTIFPSVPVPGEPKPSRGASPSNVQGSARDGTPWLMEPMSRGGRELFAGGESPRFATAKASTGALVASGTHKYHNPTACNYFTTNHERTP
jgi:hypothetical protein